MTNANDLAFNDMVTQVKSIKDGVATFSNPTLTKREYFAAMAMQGLLSRVPNRHGGEVDLGILEAERIAAESAIMANELISALNKTP